MTDQTSIEEKVGDVPKFKREGIFQNIEERV